MQYIRNILFAVLTTLLVSLSACTNPVTPVFIEYPGEPDTVHSKVSAIVNGVRWQFSTPDTVSRGAYTNNGKLLREEDPLYNYIFSMYNKAANESLSIQFGSYFNVRSQEVQVPLVVNGLPVPNATTLGVVRDWQSMGGYFFFNMPKTVLLPLILEKDSLEQFGWGSDSYSEEYQLTSRPTGPGNPTPVWFTSVATKGNGGTGFKYNKDSFGKPIYNGAYDTIVERAWLRIERYDIKNWRISGKFSFRAVNPKGDVVDIQDGSFENVRFRYFERITP